MKLTWPSIIAAAVIVGVVSFAPGIAGSPAQAQGQAKNGKVVLPPSGPLSVQEAANLLVIREEEKLARDVYLTLNAKWQSSPFYTIAVAEQNHTDIMQKLMVTYGVPDPVNEGLVGDFVNADLKKLYTSLVEWGTAEPDGSLARSLSVGAWFEELNILHLTAAFEACGEEHVDVRTAYQHLLECSKNHLRAFVSCLAKQGYVYEPVLLDEGLYQAIMALL